MGKLTSLFMFTILVITLISLVKASPSPPPPPSCKGHGASCKNHNECCSAKHSWKASGGKKLCADGCNRMYADKGVDKKCFVKTSLDCGKEAKVIYQKRDALEEMTMDTAEDRAATILLDIEY